MKHLQKTGLMLLAALLLCQLSACGETAGSAPDPSGAPDPTPQAETTAPETPGTAGGVTFTDALGRELTVGAPPERVAVLIGSFADVWCLAGGKDTIAAAADDTWTQFDLGLPDTVARLGAVKEPNAEVLLSVRPDLVLASAKTEAAVDLLPTLEQAGIPAAYFDISSLEDYLNMLDICTRLTGKPENYTQYGTSVLEQVEAARQRAQGQEAASVLYVRATGSGCKVKNSKGSVLGEMLADLGTVNIADSEVSLLEELSMEVILASDPDKIFIVMQGSDQAKVQNTLEQSLLSNPAWQQLTAVKTGEVYYMDQALYNVKPNARWGEAYQGLADILYGG